MRRLAAKIKIAGSLGLVLSAVVAFQNCTKVGFNTPSADSLSSSLGTSSTNPICDPLGNSQSVTAQQGIAATLIYVPLAKQTSPLSSYNDILAQGVVSDSAIYLSQLNVPTREWTEGFSNDGANQLTDADGNPLLEYFALQMQTTLKLQASDSAGYYQFATISDDGAMIVANVGGGNVTLAGSIGNWHSTLTESGTQGLYLDKTSAIPLNMVYYQGPRNEIAAVVLWRKMASPTDLDLSNGNLASLQASGWNVIPTANFYLSQSAGSNPCSTVQ